ncbi:MAG: type II toxin-antitoxin system VapC family toxin [Terrimicrobiaceae bacterium]
MRTAVDSSVLICILRRQPGWVKWQVSLTHAAEEGALVLCPVVFAECSVGFAGAREAHAKFDSLCLIYDAFTPECAYLAGQVFLRYRQEGGPRQHLIPDFLIAAHASTQADRLAAIDRGYLRIYFPALPLLTR